MDIKNCFNRCKKDQVIWGSCLLNLLLSICFAYFFFDSGKLLAPLFYSIFFIGYSISVFIFGRKTIPIAYGIFCYGSIQDINFRDCTLFFILLGLIYYLPKWKILLLSIYGLDVVLVCFRHDKTVLHLLAHATFCIIFYFVSQLLIKNIKANAYKDILKDYKKLDLTEKELIVIQALIDGKPLKSIEGMSKNMPKRHITTACERNGCNSKDELLALYKLQILIKG